jgi:hyperosmotically inducible periplasmic protein
MFDAQSHSRGNLMMMLVVLSLVFGSSASVLMAAPTGQEPTRNSPNFEAYLQKEVRHQLVLLPFYSVFDNLQYKIDGARVTLLGQVVHPTLKDDAAKTVKKIEGVEAVDNQIEILPPSPMDDQIRRAEFRAIYSFPALQMYALRAVPPIHIIVKGGHVTLEGAVARDADKDAAGIRANTVPGVFSVTNNLRVDNGK